jgi:hypothetical protein
VQPCLGRRRTGEGEGVPDSDTGEKCEDTEHGTDGGRRH